MRIIASALVWGLLTGSAAGQTGTLTVLNTSDHTASLANVAGRTVIASLPTGTGPHEVAISPDRLRGCVANTNADLITMVDLREWKIVDRLKAGREPDGYAFCPPALNP